jgi:glycerate dehydrogenase
MTGPWCEQKRPVAEAHCRVENPGGARRVVVTQELPGRRWLDELVAADCRVEVCVEYRPLDAATIRELIGRRCDGVIGQLTEPWGEELLHALRDAGGAVYSNFAVGYDNVDVLAATALGIPVGNTPGVLTETTAEMAVALTFAAARRIVEGSRYMAGGQFAGWLPTLFLGRRLHGGTLGIVGAGRIGSAYARMLVEGHKMDLVYFGPHANEELEGFVHSYAAFLAARRERPVACRRAATLEELLSAADVVSIHATLNDETYHLIDAVRLAQMKDDAVLINASRGPLVDEEALVEHCRAHPEFRAGLDVFENEPATAPGLLELPNVVAVPHLGSATGWTREGMAMLASCNVAAILRGWPVWPSTDVTPFLAPGAPAAAPSIVNALELGLPRFAAAHPAGR